jgi:hypothetical protein
MYVFVGFVSVAAEPSYRHIYNKWIVTAAGQYGRVKQRPVAAFR